MTTDFSKLKARSVERTAELIEALKPAERKTYEDVRVWKPTLDKEKGVGGAVIRFLPNTDERTLDYVLYYEHSFQNEANKKYYIERSLKDIAPSMDERDAIADLNTRLWATKIKSNQAIASKQKLQWRYIANILVVNDPANPDNNGKVFIYKFGPKIFSFIESALKPKEDILTGETPESMNAFDLWNGANLEIRIKQTDNGWNYDESKFSTKIGPVAKTDAQIEAIFNQTYSLNEYEALTNYKTKEALDKRLIEVLGLTVAGLETIVGYDDGFSSKSSEKPKTKEAPRQLSKDADDIPSGTPAFDINEPKAESTFGNNEDEEFFKNLMEEA